jgi:hypothetical protein
LVEHKSCFHRSVQSYSISHLSVIFILELRGNLRKLSSLHDGYDEYEVTSFFITRCARSMSLNTKSFFKKRVFFWKSSNLCFFLKMLFILALFIFLSSQNYVRSRVVKCRNNSIDFSLETDPLYSQSYHNIFKPRHPRSCSFL